MRNLKKLEDDVVNAQKKTFELIKKIDNEISKIEEKKSVDYALITIDDKDYEELTTISTHDDKFLIKHPFFVAHILTRRELEIFFLLCDISMNNSGITSLQMKIKYDNYCDIFFNTAIKKEAIQ